MVVVAGRHVIEIKVDRSASPRSMIVSVDLDHRQSWLFDEPGWQDLAVGVTDGVAYFWSARHLVVLPAGERPGDPVVITADEDIRLAFAVADGWLLVCETSIRYFADGELAAKLDFGEVLQAGRWEGPRLVVQDAAGRDIKVVIRAAVTCILYPPEVVSPVYAASRSAAVRPESGERYQRRRRAGGGPVKAAYRPLGKYPAVAFALFGTITAGLGLLAIPAVVTAPPAAAVTQAPGLRPVPPGPVRAPAASPKMIRTLPDTPRHAHSAHPARRVRPGHAFHPHLVKPAACSVPGAVSGIAVKVGANQATFSWTAASTGGSPLTAYVVRELTGGNVGQSLANAGTSTSLVMTGLAGGKAATFSVVAENSCGAGPSVTSPSATPTGSGSTYAATVIADKPSVYYRLAELSGTVMADSSGAAQDGTYDSQTVLGQPGALLSDQAAPSVEESSSDPYPVGSSPASLPQFNDPRSVSVWVNSTATDNPLVVAWGSTGSEQSFIVGFDQSAITVDGDNDYHVIPTSHPVADGFWHLITVTYDGSVLSAYLDGRLQGTAHFDAALATFGSSLALGASPYYYNRYVGNMQDVAVYPVALTAGQVSAQYAASGYAVPGGPPAAHASPAGPNAAQISWGAISDLADPISSYLVTASTGPNAGMAVSVPGDATAARLTGLAAGADQFTVTATNESGAGPAGTTNSYTVPGAALTYAATVRSGGAVAFDRLGDGRSAR